MRTEFENWFRAKYPTENEGLIVEAAWEAWQAAAEGVHVEGTIMQQTEGQLCNRQEIDVDTQPSWWRVMRHRIGLWLSPPDTRKPTEIQCPICGYYCLGKGGNGCIDKPSMGA